MVLAEANVRCQQAQQKKDEQSFEVGHDIHRGLGWRIPVDGIVSDERALFTTLSVPTLQRLVEAEKEGSYGVFHNGDLHIPRAHAVVHALASSS